MDMLHGTSDRPFGYTFEDELDLTSPPSLPNGGHQLLNEAERESLSKFFGANDPTALETPTLFPPIHDIDDTHPTALDDFNDFMIMMPPPSVHQVLTIDDQSQLHGFHTEQAIIPSDMHNSPLSSQTHFSNMDLFQPFPSYTSHHSQSNHQVYQNQQNHQDHQNPQAHHSHQGHQRHPSLYSVTTSTTVGASSFANTPDELQAASTLYGGLHPSPSLSNPRSFSVPNLNVQHHLSLPSSNPPPSTPSSTHTMPMVATPHGLMSEQLAALLPNHSEEGSVDATLLSEYNFTSVNVDADRTRPAIPRAYSYGTDSAFNSTGYNAPDPNLANNAERRVMNDLRTAQPLVRATNGESSSTPVRSRFSETNLMQPDSDDGPSPQGTESEDKRPAKKRKMTKKSLVKKEEGSPARPRKNSSPRRNSKARNSVDEGSGKKKRSSVQKPQRENLTDAQKRNNHILSEQKRRNLIKRGFDELNEIVPELRNGGLSKSGVLTEAANFLESIVNDNERYLRTIKMANGR